LFEKIHVEKPNKKKKKKLNEIEKNFFGENNFHPGGGNGVGGCDGEGNINK
jgi:hypothetical protein